MDNLTRNELEQFYADALNINASIRSENEQLKKQINDQAHEIEALKAERDGLAAQVVHLHEKLGKALDLAETGAANNWYLEGADDIWVNEALAEHAKGIPEAQQCLREIEAEAGRAGFVEGVRWLLEDDDDTITVDDAAYQYAATVRQGGAE